MLGASIRRFCLFVNVQCFSHSQGCHYVAQQDVPDARAE